MDIYREDHAYEVQQQKENKAGSGMTKVRKAIFFWEFSTLFQTICPF